MPNERILLLGDRGMVGRAVSRALTRQGRSWVGQGNSDLRHRRACESLFAETRPTLVILAAARVGGIVANATYPADFLFDNLQISLNVIGCAADARVHKLVNLGSSCIYPREAPQPIEESALLSGPLEGTNRAYAVAKIAAIEMCDALREQHDLRFISAMPCNLYGPFDNFSLEESHVVPGMIRRMMTAAEEGQRNVTLWGDGSPRRELLHVDDAAEAILFLAEHYDAPGPINVGTGRDVTIRELAERVAEAVGFQGEIQWDARRPNGTPRKLLDITKMRALGWAPKIGLEDGLRQVADWVRGYRAQGIRGWPVRA